ncbi:MAG TPA: hypothetical protein VMU94_25290 [Streptosporangiaceae bacterium]|nr:hypothetical protein [Streptosporangiaceae bacterium]
MTAEPTRRLVLAAAAAGTLTLAGCKGISVLGPLPKPGADVVTLRRAITAEELMVARYQSVQDALTASGGAGGPGKAGGSARTLIADLLAEHQAHLLQLRARLVLPPRLATASPQPSPTPPPVPHGQQRILTELATAEAAASDRLIAQLAHVPPELAQLMASIAASEAVHVVLLRRGKIAR